ncbi:MAG: hypothetical protein ACRERC_06435 [Candidatus Binatia bacterium]
MTPPTRRRVAIGLALAGLSLIATGWTAFERRLFQDDVQVLLLILTAPGGFLQALVLPISSATRRLQGAPYALALASGEPLLFLRVAGEAVTFGIGLMAAALARRALRLGAAAAFAAGALTITASSDWLTASLVALGYNLSILLHLAGAFALVRWSREGGPGWLAAAIVLGNASLWTIDAAALVHPLTPLLALLACDDPAMRRRAVWGGGLWLASAVPYYSHLLAFLTETSGYVAHAVVAAPWSARLERAVELFFLNFAPWRWGPGRPNWFRPPPAWLSPAWCAALIAVGLGITGATLAYLQRGAERRPQPPRRRALGRFVLMLLFTALSTAPYAVIQFSQFRYRTQLLGRVWASLAVALVVAGLLAARTARARALGIALIAIFVGLGLRGGLERQDYFVGYGHRHRTELASLATALPAVDAEAQIVLRLPPHDYYAATEAAYLARAWVTLLGAEPSLESRTWLVAPARGATCEATAAGLVCGGENLTRGKQSEARAPQVLPYERLVVLSYDPPSNRYHLETQLPADLLPPGDAEPAARRAYAPAARVRDGTPSWLARDLLELPAPPAVTP